MITLITGDHPRHIFLAKNLSEKFEVDNWIIQRRENIFTDSYKKKKILHRLEKLHFEKRFKSEKTFFTDIKNYESFKIKNIIKIKKEEINNGKLKKKLRGLRKENLISYGCKKIGPEILKLFKLNKWNVHGGLSPWYRGSITHFWPTYLLEPEFTGMTLHKLSEEIDGGEIIHQSAVKINAEDGIHDNACRCVRDFILSSKNIITEKFLEKNQRGIAPYSSGRIWTESMWNPFLLKLIYEKFEDKVNKFCIKNKSLRKPKLQSVLIK